MAKTPKTPPPQPKMYVPPPYVPKTPISDEAKAKLVEKARAECLPIMEAYGLQKWPDDILDPKLYALKNAVDAETAHACYARVIDRLQIHLWGQWIAGRIPGPINPQNAEAKAKKAEGLAKYLESIGNSEGAQKQLERADRIREKGE